MKLALCEFKRLRDQAAALKTSCQMAADRESETYVPSASPARFSRTLF
jgi:hypothetical protein